MAKSLLFIPDISGFTNFVQTTEAEHSQHVIAELLEVLIASNIEGLRLAEIEGDALFFYKEGQVLSQEKLLAQVETMYTAFYSHLKMMEKNRICPCFACSSAVNLELKIVAHIGDLQFLEVQGNRKPFGEAVIEAHRLLKNSIDSDSYILISEDLANEIKMPKDYGSKLFRFRESVNSYDNRDIHYLFSEIKVGKLQLKPFQQGEVVVTERAPNLSYTHKYNVSASKLLEIITNYKYRHLWSAGIKETRYDENEVTRLGTKHMCVVGSNSLDFTVITKENTNKERVYGEETRSLPSVDVLRQFFNIIAISEQESELKIELFWESKSFFKKMMVQFFTKKALIKNTMESMSKLAELIAVMANDDKM